MKWLVLFCALFSNLLAKELVVQTQNPIVCLETTQGTIEIQLFPSVAPKTCENFITLVQKHYYDGIIFHRVIKDFMIQTGDPTGTGTGGNSCWGKPFNDEVRADVAFDRPGIVAMANAGPNTNGSQFFITTKKTPWLNMHHTIFGEVIAGEDVVTKIENTPTNFQDKPKETQKIIKAYLKQ
ncbi:MAG: peptidylprolyl isomerase [Parachlamydiales bacterium]|nr:peptidylprolyl isomerase [Parachlamydiales bacterium]